MAIFNALKTQGYTGSYFRLAVWVRRLRQEITEEPNRNAFVPLLFAQGEAFQFDWSCEYVWIGGLRRRLEVAHSKLAYSRAFWMVAYFKKKPRDAVRCPYPLVYRVRWCPAERYLRQHEDRS
jgi:hypothetical protein